MKGDRALRPEWLGAAGAPQDDIYSRAYVFAK